MSRSALLPNINAFVRETMQKINLRALGVRAPFLPTVVGPFNYFDLRATLSQSIFDAASLGNYRAAKETVAATEQFAADTRDTIVLAVTGSYLQTLAAEARLTVAKAQLDTARALLDQATAMNREGVMAAIDVNRSRVQMQMQEQRLITLENDVAKQKLNLARMIGLAPGQPFTLADSIPFAPFEPVGVEDALRQASATRADLHAAEAQFRSAERAREAARAERLPSLSVSADYGVIGVNPAQATSTYSLTGILRIPVWQGGRTTGAIEQASAVMEQRRAELAELRGRIDAEVRTALLDVGSAASQQRVAISSRDVARQNLELTRQRFEAGVADTTEVVRAQESLETAEYDVVASAFSHNLARAALARAIGDTETRMVKMLGLR
jgi:outer membrane protein TolC